MNRPLRRCWYSVVRASRRGFVAAASAFLAVAAIAYQLVTLPMMFALTLLAAVWCFIVGGKS